MKLTKKYATNNIHYKNNKEIPVKRLVLHSVGTPQPSADVFARLWDSYSVKYLAQIVVGTDVAYEILPCMQTKGKAVLCYHVGNANNTSIGVELTEPNTIKYTGGASWTDLNPTKTRAHVMKTYENAVDIFAQLCKFHNLDPTMDGVILSHSECYKRGIGTNHGDVEHLWSKFGLTMDKFRRDVKDEMKGYTPVVESNTSSGDYVRVGDLVKLDAKAVYYNGKFIPAWVKSQNWYVLSISGDRVVLGANEARTTSISSPVNSKYVSLAIEPLREFKVKVSISTLNMRTGPSTKNPSIGYVPVGVYTIVETNGDWGKLKAQQNYKGKFVDAWISLKYAKKV